MQALEKYMPKVGKCVDSFDECLYYRGGDGTSCPVGAFMRSIDFKGKRVALASVECIETVLDEHPHIACLLPLDVEGLRALQKRHDESARKDVKGDCISWIKENTEE